jgi:nicotinamide-nucleotide amidase
MKALILNIGTELTSGHTHNSNGTWIAQQLTSRGIQVQSIIMVADDYQSMVKALDLFPAQIILITGGLGPTSDDKTREFIAQLTGTSLQKNEQAIAHIQNYFKKNNRPCLDSNLKQGLFPAGSTMIPNPVGTAPGIQMQWKQSQIFAIPGVPAEMQAMCTHSIFPQLTGITPRKSFGLVVSGIGESQTEHIVSEVYSEQEHPHIYYSSLPHWGTVHIAFSAPTNNELAIHSAQKMQQHCIKALKAKDPLCIVNTMDERLEYTLVRMLQEKKQTLSVAESCTGGLIGSTLTNIPGVSSVFAGGVISYTTDVKKQVLKIPQQALDKGVVSPETALEMAKSIQKLTQSDWGIAVTGIAGPEGGNSEQPVGTVCFGIVGKKKEISFCTLFSGNRDKIRMLSVYYVLDHLRREI